MRFYNFFKIMGGVYKNTVEICVLGLILYLSITEILRMVMEQCSWPHGLGGLKSVGGG